MVILKLLLLVIKTLASAWVNLTVLKTGVLTAICTSENSKAMRQCTCGDCWHQ